MRRTVASPGGRPYPPPLVSSDLSVTEPEVPKKRPPRPWEIRQAEKAEQAQELVSIFQQMTEHLGGILNFEKAVAKNDVLATLAVTLPASGVWEHSWASPYASLTLANYSTSLLTVAAMTAQSQAPAVGAGVQRVKGGIQRTFNLTGHVVSVYGAPGASFDITVYVRPRDPMGSRVTSGVFDRIVESTVPLAANAVFNGAALDCGAGGTRFRGFAASDQAGTINMQQSADGLTWFTTTSDPIAAGFANGAVVESITALRFVRIQVVNGATAQTQFLCASSECEF